MNAGGKTATLASLNAILALASSFFYTVAAGTDDIRVAPPVVAYIARLYPDGAKLNEIARIARGGRNLELSSQSADLAAGDAIFLKRSNAALVIRLIATNDLVLVQNDARKLKLGEPEYTIPRTTVPGLTGSAVAWLEGILRGTDYSRRVAALTRSIPNTCYNVGGRTDEPVRFSIPALFADSSNLVTGNRRLYVAWRGGASPYKLTLYEKSSHRVVAKLEGVSDVCSARLPSAELSPGVYGLELTDWNGASEVEDNLVVGGNQPVMPEQLVNAPLSAIARELYYATWLTSLDSGRWVFQAQQIVSGMDCRIAWVREWLNSWGGTAICENKQN